MYLQHRTKQLWEILTFGRISLIISSREVIAVGRRSIPAGVGFALMLFQKCHNLCKKVTPWVNFINVLCVAFTRADPESIKIHLSCQCLFTLLAFVIVKGAHGTLMKLTPIKSRL